MSQNGTSSVSFECTGCKTQFTSPLPRVELVNHGRFSMAIATHEKPVACPKCGKAFVFFMKQCETTWDAQAVSEEQRRQIEGSVIINVAGVV